jgi:hypothetical protein
VSVFGPSTVMERACTPSRPYAIQILASTGGAAVPARTIGFLSAADDTGHPPLWLAKDPYWPLKCPEPSSRPPSSRHSACRAIRLNRTPPLPDAHS